MEKGEPSAPAVKPGVLILIHALFLFKRVCCLQKEMLLVAVKKAESQRQGGAELRLVSSLRSCAHSRPAVILPCRPWPPTQDLQICPACSVFAGVAGLCHRGAVMKGGVLKRILS